MAQGVNIGGIYAELELDSGKLESGLAKARAAFDATEREIKRLDEELQRGGILVGDYDARVMVLLQTQSDLAAKTQAAYSSVNVLNGGLNVAAAGMGKFGMESGNAARAMMQLGYMADDIQYGFHSIVNNIAPLFYSLSGGNASVAAGAQVAAVAINQLMMHFSELMNLIGVGTVRTEAEEMEELANKTHRTANETERLNKAKREKHEIEKMLGERPDQEEKDAKAVGKDVKEAGAEELEQGIIDSKREDKTDRKMSPDDKEALTGWFGRMDQDAMAKPFQDGIWGFFKETARALGENAGILPEQDKAGQKQAEIEAEWAKEQADKLLKQAKEPGIRGNQARQQLIDIVDQHPQNFPPGLLKELIDDLPENRRQQEKWEREGKENERKAEARHKIEAHPDDRFEQEARKHSAALKATREQAEKEAAPLIHGLAKGGDIREKLLEDPNADITDDLELQMAAMGWAKEKIDRLLDATERKVREAIQKEVDQHAGEHAVGDDQAREQIQVEDRLKARKKEDQEGRQAARDAGEEVPGINAMAQRMARDGLGQGMNAEQTAEAIAKEIKAELLLRGQGEEEAGKAADFIADQAVKGVGEEAAKKIWGADKAKHEDDRQAESEKRMSETFAASDIGHKVQAGVSNQPDKVVDRLDKILKEQQELNMAVRVLRGFNPQANGGLPA